ncbi:major facilitator superfamily domain-containing protein [Immersiella caudata]|uniref:Major facilitator superfamily domain-containing protein n=1 Tax=Immersiella caudata TaxID=314043 RepID=A0AA40CDX5_9PEZI|nr:major facilitator superfamily domain-containing protein [Immersiella caudata]
MDATTQPLPDEKYPSSGRASSPPADTTAKKTKKPLSFHLSFLALIIMVFIVSLDATILAVALPQISSDLSSSTLASFYASISFLLAVVVTQPLYTSTSDVLGRKPPLHAAFFLFVAGSIVFALAGNMSVLIAGRILQGLGAGGIDVLGEIIVADMTTLKERPMYLGWLAVPMSVGSILGPSVGGLLSMRASWRWIGWVNLPVCAVGWGLIWGFLRLKGREEGLRERLGRLDWVGMGLFGVGATALVVPLSWAGAMYSWRDGRTVGTLVGGVVVLVMFVVYEGSGRVKEPVLPLRLFRSRTAVVSFWGSFVHGMVVYSLLLYLPLFFQAVLLESALQSAVSLLPLSIITVVMSVLSAVSVEFFRQYRWNIWVGWVVLSIGLGLLALLERNASMAVRISAQVIAGIGVGVLYTILVLPVQASAPSVDDTGLAVGVFVSFRLFGAVIGLAIGSSVFSSVWESSAANLSVLPGMESLQAFKSGHDAMQLIPVLGTLGLPQDVLSLILSLYETSMRVIWYVLVGFSVFGLLTSLLTREITLDQEEMGRQRFEHV